MVFSMSEIPPASRRACDEARDLPEETTSVEIYCNRDHKGEWIKEAEEHGCSLSEYLYDLIQEGRWYRHRGNEPLEIEL